MLPYPCFNNIGKQGGSLRRIPADGRGVVSAGPLEQTARDSRERRSHLRGLSLQMSYCQYPYSTVFRR